MEPVLFGTVLTTSLLGSSHCAGMCGGFVAFYSGEQEGHSGWPLHLAYNLGRLLIYLVLGAVAGAVGSGMNLAGALVNWQHVAAVFAGVWMVAWGLGTLFKHLGWLRSVPNPLSRLTPYLAPAYQRLRQRSGILAALGIGTLSGFLPCGWLWLYVGMAAGAGSSLAGAAVLALFWLGTLPALVSLGFIVRKASGTTRRYLPIFTALLLVAFGLYSLNTKVRAFNASPGGHGMQHMAPDQPGAHSSGHMMGNEMQEASPTAEK